MTRAFGGSRPVGPACDADYRAAGRGTQYDAVLRFRRFLAEAPRSVSPKSLKLHTVRIGKGRRELGRMA